MTGSQHAADGCYGQVIGTCEVLRRLSLGSDKSLLGQREERGAYQLVVLKKLDVDQSVTPELARHAAALAAIEHPHLARVWGPETSADGDIYWVTEFASGATLHEIRAACKRAGKSVPLGLVFATIHEAALALAALHGRRLAHGDVRDGNVLVTFDGEAKVLNPGVLDCIQQLPPDPGTDVYRLSALLYECLTGQAPGSGPAIAAPSSFNHALEPQIDQLLDRALGPDRRRRFADGAALAAAVKSAAHAFMWKAPQRADFVANLFKKRMQRENVVTSSPRQRIAPEPPLIVGELVEPPTPPGVTLPPEPEAEDDRDEEPSVSVLSKVSTRTKWRAAAIVAIAVAAGLVVALVTAIREPPPPAPLIVIAMPAPAPPPAPEPTAVAEAPPPAPALEQKVAAAEPEKPVKKKTGATSKRRADDPPLPPWLSHKGR